MRRSIPIALGFIMIASTVLAQEKQVEHKATIPAALVQEVETIIDKDTDRLVEIFKGIHQDPELGFMEVNTAKIVSDELESLGYDVVTGIAKTGVVAVLKNGDGPVVMYRADMDALALEEETGLPYASTKRVTNLDGVEVPVAHLCGHDAHTTWLLGMAKVMSQLKDNWSGTLVLVGQPSEETIEGATAMVNDGLYTTHKTPEPDYFIGMHTVPIPTGSIICSNGVLMAGTEQLDVTFYGQSAHGSMPQLSKDAGLMAAYAVVQYQAIISRVLDPRDTGVITVGAMSAGLENNTIPGTAELKLNFRFFSEEVHEQLFNGVKAVSEGIARTYGMPEDKMPTIVRKGYSSPLINTDALTDRIAANMSSTGLIDSKSVIRDLTPATGSEDAHMLVHGLEGISTAYIVVGSAPPDLFEEAKKDGKAFPFSPHQSNYQVDLDAIPLGAKIASLIVLDLLIK